MWNLVCCCDSNYAGNPGSRRNIFGDILYVRNAPISLRSKVQKSVTLSSSEAMFVMLSEAVKEIVCRTQFLKAYELGFLIPLLLAIFTSNNHDHKS